MADSKISGLPSGTITASDDIVFEVGGVTKSDTVQGILDLVGGGGNLGDTNLTADANRTYKLNGNLASDTLIIQTAAAAAITTFRGDGTFFNKPAGFMAAPSAAYSINVVSNGLSGGINIAGNAVLGIIAATSSASGTAVKAVITGTGNPIAVQAEITSNATTKISFKSVITGTATTNTGVHCDVSGGTNNYAINFVNGDLKFSTGGHKIGTSTLDKFAFWNATPVAQPAHIADPAGGGTVDAEARTAINAINAFLATTGLTAAS